MSRREDVTVHSNGDYWQACYYTLEGKRKRVPIGPKSEFSKAAAQREANKLAAEFIARPTARAQIRTITLGQYRPEYFRIRANDLKDGTVALHEQAFDRLLDFFGEGCKLDRISPMNAAGFRSWLCDQPSRQGTNAAGKTIGNQTVARHIRDAKVIFGQALTLGLCKFNPFEAVKPGSTAVAKTWRRVTRDELKQIMAAASGDWPLVFALARLAGLRRGEILRLTWADIDWHQWLIHVLPEEIDGERREGSKQRERWVPVEPELQGILREAFETAPDRTVLVCRIPTNNLHRSEKAAIEKAGLGAYSKPLHTLKKCLASEWLEKGHPVTDVAAWLGDSVDVLLRHYAESMRSSAARVTGHRDELAELRAEKARLEAQVQAMKEAGK